MGYPEDKKQRQDQYQDQNGSSSNNYNNNADGSAFQEYYQQEDEKRTSNGVYGDLRRTSTSTLLIGGAAPPSPPALPSRQPSIAQHQKGKTGIHHSVSNNHGSVSRRPLLAPIQDDYKEVYSDLTRIYKRKIKPLETTYNFEGFHSAPLTDSDIVAKPMVLLLGQYSTGKTTFIKHLIESDYPGSHIGVEPTVRDNCPRLDRLTVCSTEMPKVCPF